MKSIFKSSGILLLSVLLTLAFLSSCSKEDNNQPVTTKAYYNAINKFADKNFVLYNLQSGYWDEAKKTCILLAKYGDVEYNERTFTKEVNTKDVGTVVYFFYRDADGYIWKTRDGLTLSKGQTSTLILDESTIITQIQMTDPWYPKSM